MLLHFTAACDALDHNVLISHLEQHVRATALEWLKSKLSDRSLSVSHGKCHSSLATLCGIAQGFILGPLLFSINWALLLIKHTAVSWLSTESYWTQPHSADVRIPQGIRAWLVLTLLNFHEVIIFGPSGPSCPPFWLESSCNICQTSCYQPWGKNGFSRVDPFYLCCDLKRFLQAFVIVVHFRSILIRPHYHIYKWMLLHRDIHMWAHYSWFCMFILVACPFWNSF